MEVGREITRLMDAFGQCVWSTVSVLNYPRLALSPSSQDTSAVFDPFHLLPLEHALTVCGNFTASRPPTIPSQPFPSHATS